MTIIIAFSEVFTVKFFVLILTKCMKSVMIKREIWNVVEKEMYAVENSENDCLTGTFSTSVLKKACHLIELTYTFTVNWLKLLLLTLLHVWHPFIYKCMCEIYKMRPA